MRTRVVARPTTDVALRSGRSPASSCTIRDGRLPTAAPLPGSTTPQDEGAGGVDLGGERHLDHLAVAPAHGGASSPVRARPRLRGRDAWRPGSSGPRMAIVQFVVCSVALLAVVATIGAVALRHIATGEALGDARSVTVAFGRGVLSDQVTPAVLRGDPAALARLDRAVRRRVLGHPIVRLKVWTAQGRIAYSDARPLIGRTFPLPDDLREALAGDAARADVSDLSRPETRFERGRGRLVEVYLPLRLASGERVLVEAYHPAGRIDASGRRIWRTFLPVLLGVLVALAVAQLAARLVAGAPRAGAGGRARAARSRGRARAAASSADASRPSSTMASSRISRGRRSSCTPPRTSRATRPRASCAARSRAARACAGSR